MKSLLVFVLVTNLLLLTSAYSSNVNLCCPEGYLFIFRSLTCWERHKNITSPVIFSCEKLQPSTATFIIDEFGDMNFTSAVGTTHVIEANRYCIANNTKITNNTDFTKVREFPVFCLDPPVSILDHSVLSYCLVTSAIFLAITTIIYTALPELRRDVQGMSLVNFCGSLTVGMALLAAMTLSSYSNLTLCGAAGFFCYFFVIVSFFWSNAIAIQVLRSVRRPTIIGSHGWEEFRWYALYAWGCGALLTVCMVIANYVPGDHVKSGIGLQYCWFEDTDRRPQWYYMYSVMTILLTANICIFVYTSTLICRRSFSPSSIVALKYKLVFSIRLIILLGLPWIFEMVIASFDDHILGAIMNVFNTLQGVFIFVLLVVFRKKAIRAMHAHGWLACMAGPVERYLARGADDEELAVQHTEVPMNDHNGI